MRIGSKEAREAARLILESPEYRHSLQARAANGTLPAAIEVMLWHYRYGKPPDKIEIEVREEDLSKLSPEELAARASAIASDMAELQSLTNQLENLPRSGVN